MLRPIFRTNSLRRSCYRPTSYCNNSRDPVDILKKLRLRRKLRQALLRPAISANRMRAHVESYKVLKCPVWKAFP